MMFQKIYGYIVAGTIVLVIAGCGGKIADKVAQKATEKMAEKAIESSMKEEGKTADVKIDGGNVSMNVTSEDGASTVSTGENVQIPANFPKDVPLYPGLTFQAVQAVAAEEMFNVIAVSKDPLAKLTAFYKESGPKNGWKEETSMSSQAGSEPMQMFSYTKEGRSLSVMLMTSEEGTQVTVTAGKQ